MENAKRDALDLLAAHDRGSGTQGLIRIYSGVIVTWPPNCHLTLINVPQNKFVPMSWILRSEAMMSIVIGFSSHSAVAE